MSCLAEYRVTCVEKWLVGSEKFVFLCHIEEHSKGGTVLSPEHVELFTLYLNAAFLHFTIFFRCSI